MPHLSFAVIAIIAAALLFDFLNGMHDAASAIATVVSTRVMNPRAAVLWASFFNFIAVFFFGVHVATTIGRGLVSPAVMDNRLIASALIGASLWNWLTIQLGIPVSSSHSLIGGLVGAALLKAGIGSLLLNGLGVTVLFMFLAPPLGFLFAFAIMVLGCWVFRNQNPGRMNVLFRYGQLFSSAILSLAHGANDSQKTVGLISALLFANGYLGPTFHVPRYVLFACYAVMGTGTFIGGWRVIRTMGDKVTKLRPFGGFSSQAGAGACILLCSLFGIPVSTTHVVTGSLVGVGSIQRLSAVRWGVAGRIVWAWVLTIPCAAAVSALTYEVIRVVWR